MRKLWPGIPAAVRQRPTAAMIEAVLNCDVEAGTVVYRCDHGFSKKQGEGPRQPQKNWRYATVRLYGYTHLLHRILWTVRTGSPPDGVVDHIDGNTTNNRADNLRLVSKFENAWNSRGKGARSGLKGAFKSGDKFCSAIRVNGVVHQLGRFATAEDAHAAYMAAAVRLHGQFATARTAVQSRRRADFIVRNGRVYDQR